MPNEPRWLPIEEIIAVNRDEVAVSGEPFHILSQALLESAWAKPINLWNYEGEYDMVALAASLLFGIARNHAFAQGNKRTGLTSAVMFLRLNGYEVTMPDSVFFAELILAVIDGRGTEKEFTDLLRPRVVSADQSIL